MPNLPDLQTTLISTICYFDAGVVIKKSDILPILESFVEYDNGVDGVMSFTYDGTRVVTGTRIKVQVRIRTDGMCYAYGLRADDNKTGSLFDHLVDGTKNWQRALLPTGPFGNTSPAQGDTLLFRAVQQLVNAVTTAGKIVPAVGTVSYYDFEFTSTGNIYVFGNTLGPTGNVASSPWQFTQPPGVTIYVLATRWSLQGGSGGTGTANGTMTINSTQVATKSGLGLTVGVIVWTSRQGANITAILQPMGTQNTATIAQGSTGGTSNATSNGVLVVYASS